MNDIIHNLKNEVKQNLTDNILPYWINNMTDLNNGGFYGEITGTENLISDAPKGAVLNARILWTFSSSYRLLNDKKYLDTATRAKRYLIDKFYDKEFGGIYWSLDKDGNPLDTKKQIYAIGFAIYGLSEYYRATGDNESLEYAIKLFNDIETHSFDKKKNGYFEAFTRDWKEISDMRLSNKDFNESKTMNTHLHILEPYTNLFRVWKDNKLKKQLSNLINLFISKFINKDTYHLNLFFDDNWVCKSNIISYGHDIEASWLIHEAALVLNDEFLLSEVEQYVEKIAIAATEGFFPNAGMIYELNISESLIDADRHWWVQAEAIVGYINTYQYFLNNEFALKAIDCWEFVKKHIIDHNNGEWYWSIKSNGEINKKDDKAGFWKCPYHNSRMCLEIIERFK